MGEPPLTEGEGKTEKAACVFGNPVAEELFSLFSGVIGSFIKADGKDVSRPGEVSVLSCAGEDAVFDALKDGSAAVAVLPEDALFSRYPATEFNVIYRRHLHYKQKKICYLSVFPILITPERRHCIKSHLRISKHPAPRFQLF